VLLDRHESQVVSLNASLATLKGDHSKGNNMLRGSYIQVLGRRYNLKLLQSAYQAILDEFFSGRRGIVECEFIGESVAFKVRYIYELFKVLSILPPLSRDAYVVDFGCERGDMLLLLQRLGFTKLCGINLTPYDLRWLVDERNFDVLFGDGPGKIQYLRCDMDNSRLPFGNGQVSIAILSDTLEHLSNPGWVLSEINRVMAQRGLIVIGTPNITSIRNRACLLFGRTIHGDLETWLSTKFRLDGRYIGHSREYTLDELKYMMRNYGFEQLRFCYVQAHTLLGNARENIPSFFFKLYSFFEKIWPGGRHRNVIVSQKFSDKIEPRLVPIPHNVSISGKLTDNAA